MGEFGKRNRKGYSPSTPPARIPGHLHKSPGAEEREEPSAQRGGLVKLVLLGAMGGLALFALLELGTTSFLKVQVAKALQRQLPAPFLNRDMVTGVHHRKERLDWDDEEARMTDLQRNAWQSADDAITTCFKALQTDRDDRRVAGMIDRSYYARYSYEPALRDLGFYLPCLMREEKSRFCVAELREDLVLRLNGYFGMLSVAKRNRERGPEVVANPRNDPFEQVRRSLVQKELRNTPTPLPMSFEPDQRIKDAMRDLANQGYLSESDFSSFFGLFVPKHISEILAGSHMKTDGCAG